MWEQITTWISDGGWRPFAFSGVAIAVGMIIHFLLRKWICSVDKDPVAAKARVRLMGLGVLLIVLLVLIEIWVSGIFGNRTTQQATRTQILLEKVLWTFATGVIRNPNTDKTKDKVRHPHGHDGRH